MLIVPFVKALQAPQGTCIETLHTCWCIFWWCSWHSSGRTQEEVGRAARPAQKLAPQGVVQGTWMSSKSKEMLLVGPPEDKKSYQHRPQTGLRETKQRNSKKLRILQIVEDTALPPKRPKPRQMRRGLYEDVFFP